MESDAADLLYEQGASDSTVTQTPMTLYALLAKLTLEGRGDAKAKRFRIVPEGATDGLERCSLTCWVLSSK